MPSKLMAQLGPTVIFWLNHTGMIWSLAPWMTYKGICRRLRKKGNNPSSMPLAIGATAAKRGAWCNKKIRSHLGGDEEIFIAPGAPGSLSEIRDRCEGVLV